MKVYPHSTNMASDRGSLQNEILLPGPSHRCHVGGGRVKGRTKERPRNSAGFARVLLQWLESAGTCSQSSVAQRTLEKMVTR